MRERLFTFFPTLKLIWNITGFLSITAAIIILYFLRKRGRRIGELSRKINDDNLCINTLQRKISIFNDYMENREKCENIFHVLASKNAMHDADIFHALFVDIGQREH